jgi:hypothetical protein
MSAAQSPCGHDAVRDSRAVPADRHCSTAAVAQKIDIVNEDINATLAIRAGVPVKIVSERLGNEFAAFTLKQYAHAIPGMQAKAARLVAELVDGI